MTMATERLLQLRPGMLTHSLPEGTHGAAKIVHEEPDFMTRLRAARDGQPLNARKYARLLVDGHLWMTDAEFECATNRPILRAARGDVLIAGLGLGLILNPILVKKSVTSVTVVEINADVIALVAQHYLESDKLVIQRGDIYTWRTTKKFDAIYFDIWPNVPNEYDAADIRKLKRRYAKSLNKGGWMGAWCEEMAL